MKKAQLFIADNWRSITLNGLLFGFIAFILCTRLTTLTFGASSSEIVNQLRLQSFRSIFNNPINAPYFVLRNLLEKVFGTHLIVGRFTSVIIVFVAIIGFYLLARLWFRPRTAVLATLLLGCSSWFLHTGRTATPDSLYTLIVFIPLLATWLNRSKNLQTFLIITGFAMGCLIYIPGFIWFLILGLLWKSKDIYTQKLKQHEPMFIVAYVLFVALLAPLLWLVIRLPKAGLTVLGLPQNLLNISSSVHEFITIPYQLVLHGHSTAVGLGYLPLLDVFAAAMVFLGLYITFVERDLDRNKSLLLLSLAMLPLLLLAGPVSLVILLPTIYLFVAAGIEFLLGEWLRVFPRNPIARNIGIILITIAVGFALIYNLNSYFVAYPHNPQVKATYSHLL